MANRIKIIAAAACSVAVLLLAVFLYFTFFNFQRLATVIPKPSDDMPYVFIETKQSSYPVPLVAFLTDGVCAPLKRGHPEI